MNLENVIPWSCNSDVERIAFQSTDSAGNVSRALMTLAEARYRVFKDNVPDLAVLGHVVEPMKIVQDRCAESAYQAPLKTLGATRLFTRYRQASRRQICSIFFQEKSLPDVLVRRGG